MKNEKWTSTVKTSNSRPIFYCYIFFYFSLLSVLFVHFYIVYAEPGFNGFDVEGVTALAVRNALYLALSTLLFFIWPAASMLHGVHKRLHLPDARLTVLRVSVFGWISLIIAAPVCTLLMFAVFKPVDFGGLGLLVMIAGATLVHFLVIPIIAYVLIITKNKIFNNDVVACCPVWLTNKIVLVSSILIFIMLLIFFQNQKSCGIWFKYYGKNTSICLAQYAVEENNPELCNAFGDKQRLRQFCYYELSKLSGKTEWCKNIAEPSWRNSCIRNVANDSADGLFCNELESSEEKQKCFTQVAGIYGSKNVDSKKYPHQYRNLDTALADALNVEVLNIQAALLTREELISIGQLKNLRILYITNGRFTEIPDEWAGLTKLEILRVESRPLKEIPSFVTGFQSLRVLDLFGSLIETVPSDFERLVNLEILDLGWARLTALPGGVGELPKLEVIGVQKAMISKEVLEQFQAARPEVKVQKRKSVYPLKSREIKGSDSLI